MRVSISFVYVWLLMVIYAVLCVHSQTPCKSYPKVQRGRYGFQRGSRAYLQCYGDFKLSGSPLIICDRNGIWSRPAGACDLCECPCTEHDYNSRRLTVKPGSNCYKFFQCARFEMKPGTYCWAPRDCYDGTLFNETQINGVFTGRCNHANMVQCEDKCPGPCPCH